MADQKKNPNNPQSELFRRLTRLFSGPIVNWRTQMNRKIRRTALDKYSSDFRSASGQQFKRAEYSPFDVMHSKIMAQQNRAERFLTGAEQKAETDYLYNRITGWSNKIDIEKTAN